MSWKFDRTNHRYHSGDYTIAVVYHGRQGFLAKRTAVLFRGEEFVGIFDSLHHAKLAANAAA